VASGRGEGGRRPPKRSGVDGDGSSPSPSVGHASVGAAIGALARTYRQHRRPGRRWSARQRATVRQDKQPAGGPPPHGGFAGRFNCGRCRGGDACSAASVVGRPRSLPLRGRR
jgi:hypothetical protein